MYIYILFFLSVPSPLIPTFFEKRLPLPFFNIRRLNSENNILERGKIRSALARSSILSSGSRCGAAISEIEIPLVSPVREILFPSSLFLLVLVLRDYTSWLRGRCLTPRSFNSAAARREKRGELIQGGMKIKASKKRNGREG